jgi:hypothetical protein
MWTRAIIAKGVAGCFFRRVTKNAAKVTERNEVSNAEEIGSVVYRLGLIDWKPELAFREDPGGPQGGPLVSHDRIEEGEKRVGKPGLK